MFDISILTRTFNQPETNVNTTTTSQSANSSSTAPKVVSIATANLPTGIPSSSAPASATAAPSATAPMAPSALPAVATPASAPPAESVFGARPLSAATTTSASATASTLATAPQLTSAPGTVKLLERTIANVDPLRPKTSNSNLNDETSASPQVTPPQMQQVAQTVHNTTKKFWTHTEFNWAFKNPLNSILTIENGCLKLTRGNDYVNNQWGPEYFTSCINGLGLVKTSLKNVGQSLGVGKCVDATKHLSNAAIVAGKLAINIELGNLIKGILGVLISGLKLGEHAISFMVGPMLILASFCKGQAEGIKACKEWVANFLFMFKDILSAISSLGHMVPSWLPALIMFLFPPVGFALSVLKIATKFTGIFDVAAYIGTGLILFSTVKIAEATEPQGKKTNDLKNELNKLKTAMNPLKSMEGALFGMYLLNVILEGVLTLLDTFVPGLGSIAKMGYYGALGLAGVAFSGANLYHYYKERNKEEETVKSQSPEVLSKNELTETI